MRRAGQLPSPRSLFLPSFLAAAARPPVQDGRSADWSAVTRSMNVLWVGGGWVEMVIHTGLPGQPVRRRAGDRDTRRRARRTRHGDDANASAQRNERGRQRNVGLSSVPALCRPFKLSVPPCLETPCKYVKIASAAVVVVCVVQTFFPLHFIFISIFSLPLPLPKKMPSIYFSFYFFIIRITFRKCWINGRKSTTRFGPK